MGLPEKPGDMVHIYKLLTILSDTTIDEVDSRHTKLEWQSTHPPYQLIPHTNSTPVHTWVDQLIPSPPTAITNSSPRPSIPYQLIPCRRPSVTNSSPTHDYIVGYLICFKVRHTGSQRLLILWEYNKKHIYYSKQCILFKEKTYYNM